MADVKWIKITTDIFDDEKILMIESMPSADSIIVIWLKLLTFAGKQNNDGVFLMSNRIAYTDEMFASIFRRDVNLVRLALKTFEQFGMIEIIEKVITIPNWGKHQTLDAYEKKKVRDRERIARKRAEQKALALMSPDMSPDKSPDVAFSEEEKEEDKEKDKEIKKRKRKGFTPPTLEDIEAYCKSRNNNVDAKRFFDFFDAADWVDSKGNKVRNWKQKVITWESYNKEVKQDGQATGDPVKVRVGHYL